MTFHSTAKDAAQIAKKANVKKLVLGHLSSRYQEQESHLLEAKQEFEKTIIAEDGLKIDVLQIN